MHGPEESSSTDGSGSATMSTTTEAQDIKESLESALSDVRALRAELTAAREEIDHLKAENFQLKAARPAAAASSSSNDGVGQKNEEAVNEQVEPKEAVNSAVQNGDATPNQPSDEENSAPDNDEAERIHNNANKNADNANVPSDEDDDNDHHDSSYEEEEEEEGDNDDDEEEENAPQPPPTSPDDIRLRAARTLIWADSAIKRAEAMKEQAAAAGGGDSAAGTPRGSLRDIMSDNSTSAAAGETPLSARSRTQVLPATVQIAGLEDSESDDDSVLSEDDYSAREGGGARRAGPLANIRQFLEDKIDDVADMLVQPLEDSYGDTNASGSLPPLSPANFNYCNDAMKKKMNGGAYAADDADSRSTARTPVCTRTPSSSVSAAEDGNSCADGSGGGAKPKPIMNEAMMRLSSEKKRKGLGSRLFGT